MRDKVYFASDMHFGAYFHADSCAVERKFVRWLEMIRQDAKAIILVGDIFDYWFEYKYVVPRGYTRVIGKLAELSDDGVEIHLFTGNHDIWIFDYLPEEIGCIIHREPTILEFDGCRFFIAHGDEYVDANIGFKLIRAIFHNKVCQRLYAALHPWWTVGFAHRWALHSRKKGLKNPYQTDYQGEDNEYLVRFCKQHLRKVGEDAPDFYIFGHRHIMLDLMLTRRSRLIILGDWLSYFSYASWDGSTMRLDTFSEE